MRFKTPQKKKKKKNSRGTKKLPKRDASVRAIINLTGHVLPYWKQTMISYLPLIYVCMYVLKSRGKK